MHCIHHIKIAFFVGAGVCLVFSGCKGVPTPAERKARVHFQEISRTYRPAQPNLPFLSTNSTLSDFLTFALLKQPAVEAAYYDWLGSIERITSARSLPDPQLTFQMDIMNVVSSIMPGFMANFPGPGKLRAAAALASAESDARYYAFETVSLQTTYQVKTAYYQLHFLDQRIRIAQDTLALLSELEQLARTQNSVGKVTLQDVLRAQIEQDRLQTELDNLHDSRTTFQAQFKASLGLTPADPDPPLPTPFESTSVSTNSADILAEALARSPRLKAMEAEIQAAQASIAIATKGRVPDFSLGLMADAQMSPVLYRPTATMTLPIWRDKIAAQIAEAQASKRAAQARFTAEEIALALDYAETSYLLRESSRNLALLQNLLLPKARQSLEVARSGYLSGQIDFFNLIDTERTLLGIQQDLVQAEQERELALSGLWLITQGIPVNSQVRPASLEIRSSTSSTRRGPASMNGMR